MFFGLGVIAHSLCKDCVYSDDCPQDLEMLAHCWNSTFATKEDNKDQIAHLCCSDATRLALLIDDQNNQE